MARPSEVGGRPQDHHKGAAADRWQAFLSRTGLGPAKGWFRNLTLLMTPQAHDALNVHARATPSAIWFERSAHGILCPMTILLGGAVAHLGMLPEDEQNRA